MDSDSNVVFPKCFSKVAPVGCKKADDAGATTLELATQEVLRIMQTTKVFDHMRLINPDANKVSLEWIVGPQGTTGMRLKLFHRHE